MAVNAFNTKIKIKETEGLVKKSQVDNTWTMIQIDLERKNAHPFILVRR